MPYIGFLFGENYFSFDYLLAQLAKKMLLCSHDMWMVWLLATTLKNC